MYDLKLFLHFFRANALESTNLKDQAAEVFKNNIIRIYRMLFLESDIETVETFIERFTRKYNENRPKFEDEIKEMLTVFVRVVDRNGNGVVSKDEFTAMCQAMGLNSFVERFYGKLSLNNQVTIPTEDFIKGFFDFYCNNDKARESQFEKATRLGFGVMDDI